MPPCFFLEKHHHYLMLCLDLWNFNLPKIFYQLYSVTKKVYLWHQICHHPETEDVAHTEHLRHNSTGRRPVLPGQRALVVTQKSALNKPHITLRRHNQESEASVKLFSCSEESVLLTSLRLRRFPGCGSRCDPAQRSLLLPAARPSWPCVQS